MSFYGTRLITLLLHAITLWRENRTDRRCFKRWSINPNTNSFGLSPIAQMCRLLLTEVIAGNTGKIEFCLWVDDAPPVIRLHRTDGSIEPCTYIAARNVEAVAQKLLQLSDTLPTEFTDDVILKWSMDLVHYQRRLLIWQNLKLRESTGNLKRAGDNLNHCLDATFEKNRTKQDDAIRIIVDVVPLMS